jgi:hypothetical protein
VEYYGDGTYYEGHFAHDLRDGEGTFHYNEEEQVEGQWKEGKLTGEGYLSTRSLTYCGDF